MNPKIFLILAASVLLLNLVAAEDVAYITTNSFTVNNDFKNAMNDLGLTYKVVYISQIASINFTNYRLILVNNEDFSNPDAIPVHNFPTLMVNGKNVEDWGLVSPISKVAQTTPLKGIVIDKTHPITKGIPDNFTVYTSATPDMYYLGKINMYDGVKLLVGREHDSQDAIVAVVDKGTTLTKSGKPSVQFNASAVFFGMHDSKYWTPETETLFKNSLMWLYNSYNPPETFNISLKKGENLISIPLELDSNDITKIFASNPGVNSVLQYNNGAFSESNTMLKNKGYFVNSTSDSTLALKGQLNNTQQSVQLVHGMNLVGISSLSNINLSSLPNHVIEVSKRNSDGSYTTATKYSGGWFNSFELEPGKGYWLKTNMEVDWEYGP
jgi:hypothetical protein